MLLFPSCNDKYYSNAAVCSTSWSLFFFYGCSSASTPSLSLSFSLSLSLSPSSLSLCPHLCVFSTSGQAAYEAAHVFHTPLAYVLHRVCCGRVLPIHEKTSHRAWESSSGWKWCVNINTGYRAAVQAEDPATVSDAADTHLKVNFVIFILSSFVTYDEFEEDTF